MECAIVQNLQLTVHYSFHHASPLGKWFVTKITSDEDALDQEPNILRRSFRGLLPEVLHALEMLAHQSSMGCLHNLQSCGQIYYCLE